MNDLLQQAIDVASGPLQGATQEQKFTQLAATLSDLMNADYVFVSELDQKKERATTVAAIAKPVPMSNFEYDLAGTPCSNLSHQDPCVIKANAASTFPNDDLLKKLGAQAYFGIALHDRNNNALGLLSVVYSQPVENTSQLQQMFQVISSRVASEFERRSYDSVINSTVKQCQHQSENLVVASHIYDFMSDGVIVTDRDHNIVYVNRALEAVSGYKRDEVVGKNPRVFASGLQGKKFYQELWGSLSDSGRWQGEFINRKKSGEVYSVLSNMTIIRDADGQIKNHVAVHKDISNEKEARDLIEYQNRHDQLTGLLNRYELNVIIDNTLARVNKDQGQWVFILIDLDDFKEINDSRGHVIGDQVISAIASRLKSALRGTGILARLGGDEFALFSPVTDSSQVNSLLSKISEVFRFPFTLVDASQYNLTASIGVSLYPNDAQLSNLLYAHADQALYRAKSLGKNSHVFFTQEMEDRTLRQQTVRIRLQKAVAEKKIEPYFQPIVDLATGDATYCEALARWHDNDLGAVYPSEFIPIAENYGLMPALGLCIAEKAVAAVAQINSKLVTPIGVSINRSPREFITCEREPLLDLAVRYKIPVNFIAIEITESLMVNDPERAEKQLISLRSAGFKLAMDDFGTGYSSLAYLKQFPFHVLKIDRTFINDIEQDNEAYILVKTIIEMAKNFNMKTVAEGVETESQLNILKRLGCEYGQGYYFSMPVTATKLTNYLLDQEAKRVHIDAQLKEGQRKRLSRILNTTSAVRGNEF